MRARAAPRGNPIIIKMKTDETAAVPPENVHVPKPHGLCSCRVECTSFVERVEEGDTPAGTERGKYQTRKTGTATHVDDPNRRTRMRELHRSIHCWQDGEGIVDVSRYGRGPVFDRSQVHLAIPVQENVQVVVDLFAGERVEPVVAECAGSDSRNLPRPARPMGRSEWSWSSAERKRSVRETAGRTEGHAQST